MHLSYQCKSTVNLLGFSCKSEYEDITLILHFTFLMELFNYFITGFVNVVLSALLPLVDIELCHVASFELNDTVESS